MVPLAAVATGPISVAVAGLGNWGVQHLRAWQSLPDAEVVAICERDPGRLREVQEEYGIQRGYANVAEMLEDSDLAAASVATRESDRLDVTGALLEAGVHVLVEKPLALNLDDASQMLSAAQKNGRVLMPGHVLRFDVRFAAVKEQIDRGRLGPIRSVYSRRLMPKPQYDKYASNHLALMAAIHDFDIARWYFGAEPVTAHTVPGFPPGGTTPDYFWSILDFGAGAVAVIEAGWVLPAEHGAWLDSETRVLGRDGLAAIREPGDSLTISTGEGEEHLDTTTVPFALGNSTGALREEIMYFMSCIRSGRLPTRVSAQDGLESLRVALAVARAGETGKVEPVLR
jgi:UDP-N-acetylglucosamine 3-dehydrogenase